MISEQEKVLYKEKFLIDEPIFIEELGWLYTPTIFDILSFSSDKYFDIISKLCATKYSFNNYEDLPDDFNTFFYIYEICKKDEKEKENILKVLSFFTKKEIIFIEELGVFLIKKNEEEIYYITDKNFPDLQEIIRLQNNLKKPEYKPPRNKHLREMEEKAEKGRLMIQKAKGENMSFLNQVLNLSVYLNSLNNVKILNIFCFNNLYKKFVSREEYKEKLKVLLAGGDSKKVDLKNHWTNETI